MLELNPKDRMSASNLVKYKAFENVKHLNYDESCPIQVDLDFDDCHKMSDDLNEYVEEVRSQDVDTIVYFKRKILKELILFARSKQI